MALAACSTPARRTPPEPEPEPPYRQLITDNMGELFQNPKAVRILAVSTPQRVQLMSSEGWRVCLKVDVSGMQAHSTGVQTYAITILRGQIIDRRLALPTDGCENAEYARFAG